MWFWDLLGNILGYGLAIILIAGFFLYTLGTLLGPIVAKSKVKELTKRSDEIEARFVTSKEYSISDIVQKNPDDVMYTFAIIASLSLNDLRRQSTIPDKVLDYMERGRFYNISNLCFRNINTLEGVIFELIRDLEHFDPKITLQELKKEKSTYILPYILVLKQGSNRNFYDEFKIKSDEILTYKGFNGTLTEILIHHIEKKARKSDMF